MKFELYTSIERFLNHKGFKKYFKNTFWLFLEKILRLISGLLVGVWVARYLGPKQFGVFSYAIAFTALFGGIAKLGLDTVVVQELIKKPEKQNVLMGSAYWLKLFGSLISLILIFFVSTFSNNDAKTTMYVVILGAGTIFQSFETIDFFFQSKVLAKYVSACKLIQLSISSIVKVFLVVSKKDLFWFVLANFLDQVTLAISLYFAYRTRGNKAFFKKFELMTAKNLLADSWPLILSSLMVIIYMRIDQIMIKQMLNSEAVGQYAAAVKVSEIWNFVPVLIVNSLFPAIISAKKISESLYYQRLQQLYTLLFWISVCFALPITLLSKSLINILFGHKYMEAASILVIHVWTGVFISFSAASARWYILEGLSVVQFYRQLFGAIICIFLNFLLIPPMGTIGAAVSTLISYFCASYLFDLFSKNTRICLLQKTYSILFKGLLKQAR